MIPVSAEPIELSEYQSRLFPRQVLPEAIAELLWRNYHQQVGVDFPSPKTGWQWQLTAQGWVGYIPLTPEYGFRLLPKVALGNLFGMLEYAYRLKSFQFLESLIDCQSLDEFYERLANVLARRVLDRGRKGFYRAFLNQDERLPYVRGRLDVPEMVRMPWNIRPHCHYEEHTADIEENHILTWALWRIARSGMCTERVLPTVRRAYRSLQGMTSLQPISPDRCSGRRYNRLNDDYQPMHALSRFFLEQSGPSHQIGDRQVLPFLVDMAQLFELFVAEWLRQHVGQRWLVKVQERVPIGEQYSQHFAIDLVLYDAETGQVAFVLDTKYRYQPCPQPMTSPRWSPTLRPRAATRQYSSIPSTCPNH